MVGEREGNGIGEIHSIPYAVSPIKEGILVFVLAQGCWIDSFHFFHLTLLPSFLSMGECRGEKSNNR